MPSPSSRLGVNELNQQFYDLDPSLYLTVRMTHLALIATHDDEHAARLARGVEKDKLKLTLAGITESSPERPTPSQQFAAVEAEILLSHAAETVLRYVYAHAEPSSCPWQRMAALTSAGKFKAWVENGLLEAPDEQLDNVLVERLFVLDENGRRCVRVLRRYIREFARLFLDANAYNAGKHGLGLSGGDAAIDVQIANSTAINGRGMALSYLSFEGSGDARTWTHHTHLRSLEVCIGLVYAATRLLDGIRDRGASEHLDAVVEPFAGVASLPSLLTALGYEHTQILAVERDIADDGRSPTVRVRTARLQADWAPEPLDPDSA